MKRSVFYLRVATPVVMDIQSYTEPVFTVRGGRDRAKAGKTVSNSLTLCILPYF